MSIDEDVRPDEGWSPAGGGRGSWSGARPTFENPMSWSLPVLRVAGITVRVHVLFLLAILIMVARSLPDPQRGPLAEAGPVVTALVMGTLMVIVLLHELGHCLACRAGGGEADEILMWPLGGLAFCRSRHHWRSHLATVLGGPAVNALICVAAMPFLAHQTGRWLGTALPDPFSVQPLHVAFGLGTTWSWPLRVLFIVNWMSLVLLIFNLLPILPLDGGRILQALLWPWLGYARSMRVSIQVGYLAAVLLGVWGAVELNVLLLSVAVFGALFCYFVHRRLEFTEAVMAPDGHGAEAGETAGDEPETPQTRRERLEREQHEAAERLREEEARRLDEILAKIASSGMDSLSARERRILDQETRRRRGGGAG